MSVCKTLRVDVSRDLPFTIDSAWAAISRSECLGVWLARGASSDTRVGGTYRDAEGGRGEYCLVEEPRRLAMVSENTDLAPGSRVDFSLEPAGEGACRIAVAHTGIPAEDQRARLHRAWAWAVDSLEHFLRCGEGLPYEPWLELQAELRRRADTMPAEEAAAQRREAGVILHDVPLPGPRAGAKTRVGTTRRGKPAARKAGARKAGARKAGARKAKARKRR
jgi:uncharacterized protein YndB with AHSA1/START domain